MSDYAYQTPPRPTPKSGKSVVTRAKSAANDAGSKLQQEVESNPLTVLAGGIAVGLLAGALLPRARRETELLGSLGARLNGGAKAAVQAAKTAGTAELAAAGLNRVNANDQVAKLIEAVIRALGSAGTAAKEAAKDPAAAKPARKPRAKPAAKA